MAVFMLPATESEPSLWPTQLRPFLRSHGVDVVFLIGIELHGFPPTWGLSARQTIEMVRALERLPQETGSNPTPGT